MNKKRTKVRYSIRLTKNVEYSYYYITLGKSEQNFSNSYSIHNTIKQIKKLFEYKN